MKLNYNQLEELFDKINNIITRIEKSTFLDKSNTIFLGNGEKLSYHITKDCIPHLLGINIPYLRATNTFKNDKPFELLKEMISNPFKVNDLINKSIINSSQLFSEYLDIKIDNFYNNCELNIHEIELVCKYSKSRTYTSLNNSQNFDYLIVRKNFDESISLLGIVKDDDYYVPMTNQYFPDFEGANETLERYLKDQEISNVTGINDWDAFGMTANNNLYLDEKIKKIENLKEYKKLFNCSIDLCNDFLYTINKLSQNKKDKFAENDIILKIVEAIKNGKIIDASSIDDSSLIKIIYAHNDSLYSKNDNNSSINKSYTDMIEKLKKLREELMTVNHQNDKLTIENEHLMMENTKLDKLFKDTLDERDKRELAIVQAVKVLTQTFND